jgi:hypothetical protein
MAFCVLALLVVTQAYVACHADPNAPGTPSQALQLVEVVLHEDHTCYVSMSTDPATMLALLDVIDSIVVFQSMLYLLIMSGVADFATSRCSRFVRTAAFCASVVLSAVCCAYLALQPSKAGDTRSTVTRSCRPLCFQTSPRRRGRPRWSPWFSPQLPSLLSPMLKD